VIIRLKFLSDRCLDFTDVPGAPISSVEIRMIRLTRLNNAPIVLNSDLIEHVDVTPDTVILMTTGQVFRVRESADEVVERIVQFRRRIWDPNWPKSDSLQIPDGHESQGSE